MNNARYTLTFYGGLWLAGFIILFLTPGWPVWSIILACFLAFLCPVWQHLFEFMLEKRLYEERRREREKRGEGYEGLAEEIERERNTGRG